MSLIERIYQVADFKGDSIYKISKDIGVSNGYFAKTRVKNGSVGGDIIEKIVSYYDDVNVEWLVTGKGSMLKPNVKENVINQNDNFNDNLNDTIPNVQKKVIISENSSSEMTIPNVKENTNILDVSKNVSIDVRKPNVKENTIILNDRKDDRENDRKPNVIKNTIISENSSSEMAVPNVKENATILNGNNNGNSNGNKPNVKENVTISKKSGLSTLEELQAIVTAKSEKNSQTQQAKGVYNPKGIPLLPFDAFAGIGESVQGVNFDVIQERYVIPLFDGMTIDFMIPVRGASMYPKYSSGDVVACRLIKDILFFQWNKVYVLDTESQGVIMKRLKKSNKEGYITCVSDNEKYDPFDIPMSDIRNIALVIGVIRLE